MRKKILDRTSFHCSITCRLSCIILFLLQFSYNSSSQISIEPSNGLELSPENLVRNVFIGQGVRVESIEFRGTKSAIGIFRNAQSDLGLDRGIVLSTGEVMNIDQSNNDASTGSSTSLKNVKDEQLEVVAGGELFDVAVLEIQFRPVDNRVAFNFVFGSEEYPEFVCSEFNDVFAFFIDGPNPAGGNYISENIALVPDPNDPTGQTYTNFPVTINSVNNGMIGTENLGDCQGPGESLDFSTYFNDNTFSRTFTLDGYLDVFRARANVIPCELYTLKLAIGDGHDFDFDSAVFMEAKSFSSSLHTLAVNTPGIDYSIMEGCDPAIIEVKRSENINTELEVHYTVFLGSNSATQGEDYVIKNGQLKIPVGAVSTALEIEALNDDLVEDDEIIYLVFQNGDCFHDTIPITILDFVQPQFVVPVDTSLCDGEIIEVEKIDAIDQLHIFEKSGEFIIGDAERGDCRSTIVVSDLDVEYLNDKSFHQVCIDFLEHQWLNELEFYLISPSGQIVELSSNNGEDGGNGSTTDQMINTCFTIDAVDLINNGNSDEGDFLSSNPTYTGNFIPEQSFNSIFSISKNPVNGKWTLVIKDNKTNSNVGILHQWSLKFSPIYTEQRECKINDVKVVRSTESISSNSVLDEVITNNYGCTFERTSNIQFVDLPDPPFVSCSNPLRNEVQLDWISDVADQYELKFGGGNWMVLDAKNYLFEDLGLGSTYQFQIRSVRKGCLGPSETFFCETPECGLTNVVLDQILSPSSGCVNDGSAIVLADGNDGPYSFRVGDEVNTIGAFQELATDIYRVYIEDRYGCTFSKTFEINGVKPFETEIIHRKVSCDASVGGAAWLEVNGGTPPYIYRWSNGERTSKVDQLVSGSYSVTVGDNKGCIEIKNISIENSTQPILNYTQENVLCKGESTGAISLMASGGEEPYTYKWGDGYTTVVAKRDELKAGNFEISVVDRNLCEDVVFVEIREPEEFSATIITEDNSCPGVAKGLAELSITGGVEPYSIFWSTGDRERVLRNIESGQYGVTITDAGGCEIRKDVTINAPEKMRLMFDHSPITCNEGKNGSISVHVANAVGNYEFHWDNNETNSIISNLSSGMYCVTVTNESSCIADTCFILENPESMQLQFDITNVTCYKGADGGLNWSVDGGIGPYEFEINGEKVQTSLDRGITDLRAGLYFVKVRDNTGCIATKVAEVKEAPEPQIVADVENVLCFGEKSGSIFIKYLNEPDAPVSWIDDNGNTYSGRILSSMYSGNFHYEIETRSGCILTGTVIIGEPDDPLRLNVDYKDITCNGDRDGEIVMSAEGGGGSYFFSMDGVGYQRSGLYSGLKEGMYHTFVQDINGCVVVGDSLRISNPESLKVKVASDTIVNSGTDVPISAVIENAQGEVVIQWEVDPDQNLSCDDCLELFVNDVNEDFILKLVAEDENFCRATDDMQVFVVRDYTMHVPTGFSPNGDGKNELLNVFGSTSGFVREFNVFLRNGINIYNEYNFAPNDIGVGWDGTFRSKLMPAGIYIWTMHVEFDDGARESYKGSVQLIR